MRFETSSSKGGLFYPALWKKNMARFWPIWCVYGLCWLFAMPMELLISRSGVINEIPYPQYFADVQVLDLAAFGGIPSALVFGILAAMAVFSYLYNSRSVGLLHALPVRREGLFLTNYLSGLSFLLLPSLAVFLLMILAEAALGVLNLGALCMWLAMQVLLSLFFYSFAVFCAMFTGHILALPAFYGILNGLVIGLVYLINQVLHSFVFGFDSLDLLERIAVWLTPAYRLASGLYVEEVWNEAGNALVRVAFHGLGYGLVYALAGLLLAGTALWFYRRRDLEGAGDVVTVRWTRPVFKYGVAFCSALALGMLLYAFFLGGLTEGVWPLLCCMVLCGWAGYFAAEMLLKKSFWVFRQSWKGCAVFTLCLAALTVGMELDVTGYERRTPDPRRVEAVWVGGVGSAPRDSGNWMHLDSQDPEIIRAVTELHQAILRERDLHETEDWSEDYVERALSDGGWETQVQTKGRTQFRLRYDLANGSVMYRDYSITVTEEALGDPDSAAARLAALLNRPEIVEQAYFASVREEDMRLTGISLDLREESGDYDSYPVPTAYRDELFAAIQADMAAGRLGIRYLLEDEDCLSNCYYNDLRLEYNYTGSRADRGGRSLSVTLQTTATETLEVLREAGVLDDGLTLETQAQVRWREQREDMEADAVFAEPVY